MTARALLLALGAAITLGGCGRKEEAAPQASVPAASSAGPAASNASASATAMAPPLVPQQVVALAAENPQDVAAGSQLATQGAGAVTACAGCHGATGEGNAQTGFPRLAGLGRAYLVHQLESYANGSRKNPTMQPIATAMNDEQRRVAAAFYASQGNTAQRPAAAGREPVLAAQGDDRRQLQACANCHGPQGIGDAAVNPYLAGQVAGYLTATLAQWKNGERNNDPSGQMPRIAQALSDDEVKTLVAYYSGLPAPPPRNAQMVASALPASRSSVQSGPSAQTAPQQGTGIEQGALTGGAQGQGAGGAATNPGRTAPQAQQR